MGLPPVWCTTYIILLDQCYTRSERSIASSATIMRHLLHMDHPLNLQCHPLKFVCNPFKVEGEGELIDEVMVEMVGEVVVEMVREVVVEMVREVVVHLSRHCLLPYSPHTYPSPDTFILPHIYTSLDIFIPRQTYASPSIPPHIYRFLPSPVSQDPASMGVDMTLSSHPLSFLTLPPIDETMVDLVLEFGALPARRPRVPCIRRILHPSAPSTPSAP